MNRLHRLVHAASAFLVVAIVAFVTLRSAEGAGPPPTERAIAERRAQSLREGFKAVIEADGDRDRSLDPELLDMCDSLAETLVIDALAVGYERFDRIATLLTMEGVKHPLVQLALAVAMDLAPIVPSPFGNRETPDKSFNAALVGLSSTTPIAPTLVRYEALDAAAEWAARAGSQQFERRALATRNAVYLLLVKERGCRTAGQPAPELADLFVLASMGIKEAERLPPDLAVGYLDALGAIKDIDECLLETIRGCVEIQRGWDERGSGFAGSVSAGQSQAFGKRMTAAYTHLHKAWKLDPTRPHAASLMIKVAMAGGAEEKDPERTWFDRAVAAQIDHWPAYDAYLWAARPRWGGSEEEIEAFGGRCLATKRFDTAVPIYYLNALRMLMMESGDLRWLRDPKVKSRLAEVDAGYRAAKNDRWREGISAWQCLIAYANDEYAAVTPLLESGMLSFQAGVASSAGVNPIWLRHNVWARTGPTAARVQAADTLFRSRAFAEAKSNYSAILADLEKERAPLERRLALQDRIERASLQVAFASGDWVEPACLHRMPGWEMAAGVWEPANNIRGAIGASGPEGLAPVRLLSTLEPGPRFETKAKLSIRNRKNERAEVGIFFGVHLEEEAPSFHAVQWFRNRNVIELSRAGTKSPDAVIELPKSSGKGRARPDENESVLLHVIVWDTQIAIRANDVTIFVGRLNDPSGTASPFGPGLMFGTRFAPPGNAEVEVIEPLIRILRERPAVLDERPAPSAPSKGSSTPSSPSRNAPKSTPPQTPTKTPSKSPAKPGQPKLNGGGS